MNHGSGKVFNPRQHSSDIKTAFTRFVRKFGYIYEGENRSPPTSVATAAATDAVPDLIADWKEKDKAKLFLSRAVTDEFIDDYEAAISEINRREIKFRDLVVHMNERYAPISNKVRNHYKFHRITESQKRIRNV